MPDTQVSRGPPNPPHLKWLNAGSLSSENEVSCQVHALLSRISYRLNCMSSGDNRKVCRGAPVSVVAPLPGTFPREAHRRKKTLVELGDIISTFIFCPSHYPRKQQSRTPPAFLLNVSLGPCAGASPWSWLSWGARKQKWALLAQFYLLMLQTSKTEM